MCVNLEAIQKRESKKPENPADCALGSDPDSQPVSLNGVLDLRTSLHIELNGNRTEVNGIRSDLSVNITRVGNKSNKLNKLQHSTFAVKADISIVRGFNRDLLSGTSDLKKDVYDYFG